MVKCCFAAACSNTNNGDVSPFQFPQDTALLNYAIDKGSTNDLCQA